MLAGVFFGLGASASWAIANVGVQRSARQVGALRAMLWSGLVGLALLAIAVPALGEPVRRPAAVDAAWLVGAAGAALLAYGCMFYAFEHGRLSVAVPVVSSWAVLAGALSLGLLHERVRTAQLAGAGAVVLGAIIVSRYAQHDAGAPSGTRARWLPAAIGAAVGFGLLIPAIGRLAPVVGSLGAVGAVYAAALALGLPLAWRARASLAPPPARALVSIALTGLFETAGFACIALGGRAAPLAVVSPLSSLASAFTVAYAWIVLRERPPLPVAMGAVIACTGVIALAL
jgi:drug/metabolite transporter (DMT)-like permease